MGITKEQLKILKAFYDLGFKWLCLNPVFDVEFGIFKGKKWLDICVEKPIYDDKGIMTMPEGYHDKEGYHSLICPYICMYELMENQKEPFPFYKLFEKEVTNER